MESLINENEEFKMRLKEGLERLSFVSDEINSIFEERAMLLHRFEQDNYTKQDIFNFIAFEKAFMSKVKMRETRPGRVSVAYTIKLALDKFFARALESNPQEYDLWLSYFNFCDTHKSLVNVDRLETFLQHHGNSPDDWLRAFKFFHRNQHNPAHVLERGINRHPTSAALYTALLMYELELQKTDTGPTKQNNRAEQCYTQASMNISDISFYKGAFEVAKMYKSGSRLMDKIIRDMLAKFPLSEEVWDMYARKVFEDSLKEITFEISDETGKIRKVQVREKYLDCIKIYKEAIHKVPTTRMWDLFLIFFEETQTHEALSAFPTLKISNWTEAVQGAFNEGEMDEKHFTAYLNAVNKGKHTVKNFSNMLVKASELYPESVLTWEARVRYHLGRSERVKALQVFEAANEALKDVSAIEILRMWRMVIGYHYTIKQHDVEGLFVKGLQLRNDLAQLLKPLYLQWLNRVDGLAQCRKLLDNPLITADPCLDFFFKFIDIEMRVTEPSKKAVRRLFDLATEKFSASPDLWKKRIEVETKFGDFNVVWEVTKRAKQSLSAEDINKLYASNAEIRELVQVQASFYELSLPD